METDLSIRVAKPAACGKYRILTGSSILEPCQSVKELTAYYVKVRIAVKISNARIGSAININVFALGLHLSFIDISAVLILYQIYPSVQRSPPPYTIGIKCIVPSVIIPRIYTCNIVHIPVIIPIHGIPHLASGLLYTLGYPGTMIMNRILYGIRFIEKIHTDLI